MVRNERAMDDLKDFLNGGDKVDVVAMSVSVGGTQYADIKEGPVLRYISKAVKTNRVDPLITDEGGCGGFYATFLFSSGRTIEVEITVNRFLRLEVIYPWAPPNHGGDRRTTSYFFDVDQDAPPELKECLEYFVRWFEVPERRFSL